MNRTLLVVAAVGLLIGAMAFAGCDATTSCYKSDLCSQLQKAKDSPYMNTPERCLDNYASPAIYSCEDFHNCVARNEMFWAALNKTPACGCSCPRPDEVPCTVSPCVAYPVPTPVVPCPNVACGC